MALLNKTAAELLRKYQPHAVTDITGFGLLGHSSEMARGSQVSFEITFGGVPVLEGTRELVNDGVVPGGSKSNHKWLGNDVDYEGLLPEEQLILCDAVTSGGLLVSLSVDEAEQYVEDLHQNGLQDAAIIGRVITKNEKLIYVKK
jgi:selenide,water dikinase